MSELGQGRRTLSQALTDELIARCVRGEYAAGSLLPTERGLMEEFEVGRNTVRESVRSLVALGMVEVRPGLGARVIAQSPAAVAAAITQGGPFDDDTVSDLYEFRQIIEVAIVRKAAAAKDHASIGEAEYWHERFRDALERGRATYQEDVELHRAWALASGNSVAVQVLDQLRDVLQAVRRATAAVPNAQERALEEHEAIIAAIRVGDADAAAAAMQAHLESAHWAVAEARRFARRRAETREVERRGKAKDKAQDEVRQA